MQSPVVEALKESPLSVEVRLRTALTALTEAVEYVEKSSPNGMTPHGSGEFKWLREKAAEARSVLYRAAVVPARKNSDGQVGEVFVVFGKQGMCDDMFVGQWDGYEQAVREGKKWLLERVRKEGDVNWRFRIEKQFYADREGAR